MLTNEDVEFIRESREQIRGHREIPITLLIEGEGVKDPITGETVGGESEHEVNAVVTVISTDRVIRWTMDLGVEILTGDVIADVSKIDFPEGKDYRDVKKFFYQDTEYKVLAPAMLGLAEFNRYEFLGREVY